MKTIEQKQMTGQQAAVFINNNPQIVKEISWVQGQTNHHNSNLAGSGPWDYGKFITRGSIGHWTDAPGMCGLDPTPLEPPEDMDIDEIEADIDRLMAETAEQLETVTVRYVS